MQAPQQTAKEKGSSAKKKHIKARFPLWLKLGGLFGGLFALIISGSGYFFMMKDFRESDERREKRLVGLVQVVSHIIDGDVHSTFNGRTDMARLYYSKNMLFIDEAEAGMSRQACVKALKAEGVRAGAYSYRLQHKCTLYQEPNWWHHKPAIPELAGCEQANTTAISLPYLTSEVPELVDQYAKAFEKVWAHRKDLA